MSPSAEVAEEAKVEENNATNLEVTEELPTALEQRSVECSVERKKSLQARYLYGILFLLINLSAWFFRDYGQKVLSQLLYPESCGMEAHNCFHAMGVLRVSLGCFIFFLLMFLTTSKTNKLDEASSKWHCRWWKLKIVLLIVSLGAPFFLPLDFIHVYGEVARIGAGIFLILQLISVIEFITWWDNYWMPDEENKSRYKLMDWLIYAITEAQNFISMSSTGLLNCFLGLFMSTLLYIASMCAIVFMYFTYAPTTSCSLNIFFITWTAVLVVVMLVVSLHSKVNRGLLSSGIMASYIVFLCWSAIRSEPTTENCNPPKQDKKNGEWTTVLSFLIAIFATVMATFSTGIDSQSFQFRRDKVQEEDDIPYKYGIFHMIFSLGAMYFAMLFISWKLDSTAKKWSIDTGWTSTWVKITNEWLAAAIYLWKLMSPVVRQTESMGDEEQTAQRTPSPAFP